VAEFLDTPIEYLKGVGPQRAELLKKELQIFTFQDLLTHYPFRHIDRTKFHKISEINQYSSFVQVKGEIVKKDLVGVGRKQRLTALISDGESTLELVWFKGVNWVNKSVMLGQTYIAFGRPAEFNRKFNIAHPELELFNPENKVTQKLQSVYSITEKLKKHRIDSKVFNKLFKTLFEEDKNQIFENLSKDVIDNFKLISRREAFRKIHLPQSQEDIQKSTFRLKFEELFFIQLKLFKQKGTRKATLKGLVLNNLDLFNTFYENHLPFKLTNAQQRVIKEIYKDISSDKQMNRLLQGDVGSGKTMVAFLCCLIAIGSGSQSCLMAPTEILAEQHYAGLIDFSNSLGIEIALLTGSTKKSERKILHENLKNGKIKILIGTHALLEKVVEFKNLAFCVIDEQHRFGVAQRSKLWQKRSDGFFPHILVMTATPIPRTLAMTFYGDLDVSVIDELPAGRKPVQTVHRYDSKRITVFDFIRKQINEGRQVYIVYPLIEESEKLDLKNLDDGYESVRRAFPEFHTSVVHGRMKPADKDFEMQRFVKGETQLMVATTVIEVGINVPNASVMVIENSERFGLSQLHQLRGRVGRGADQSYCILMSDYKISKDGKTRIETMCRTNDGFEIAETDLKLRGPGDLMGTQQSGIMDLKLSNLSQDADLIEVCRHAAQDIIEDDINLEKKENYPILSYLRKTEKGKLNWGRIS